MADTTGTGTSTTPKTAGDRTPKTEGDRTPKTEGERTPKTAGDRVLALIHWLRRPELGIFGQGMRYAIAGGTVALVSLTTTLVLAEGFGLAFELAFVIGYTIALITHFSLQRFFVWSYHEDFALPLRHQLARYLPIALTNYALVAGSIAILPRALGTSKLVVYLCALLLLTGATFLIFRAGVFHAEKTPKDPR